MPRPTGPGVASINTSWMFATIVEIEPAWRGFEYFMIGDQIVIVDPRSMEIVAVVEA
jgi:hypothetical protein